MEKSHFMRINTRKLWEGLRRDADHITVEKGGIRLPGYTVYRFDNVLFEDHRYDIGDVALDRCGNIYMVDRTTSLLLMMEPGTGTISALGCCQGVLPWSLSAPHGIAVDEDTVYVADSGHQALVAFARSNLQIRWSIEDIITEDLTLSAGGDLFVLSSDGNERPIILRVNRSGRIEQTIGAGDLSRPSDIAVDVAGNLYALDGSKIVVFGPDGVRSRDPMETGIDGTAGLCVDNAQAVFFGVSTAAVPPHTIYRIEQGGSPVPLMTYRDTSRRLVTDSHGDLYIIAGGGERLSYLRHQWVNCPNERGAYRGTYCSRAIDSQSAGTEWYRFSMDGEFAKGTQVTFAHYVSDTLLADGEVEKLADNEWQLSLAEPASMQGETKREGLLLRKTKGRYLWFKISLHGDETLSPQVQSLTVVFPWNSYLKYLPAFYAHREGESEAEIQEMRSFLDRFLSIFETSLSEIDTAIDHLTHFFDSQGVPSEFLSWLSSWLAVAADEQWPEEKRRLFLASAASIYKQRGTRAGLEATLDLLLDGNHETSAAPRPYYVVETFLADGISECTKINDPVTDALYFPSRGTVVRCRSEEGTEAKVPLIELLYGKERFSFWVLLRDFIACAVPLDIIKRVIQEQKPAHTCGGVKVLLPWFYLDYHTYLGVNTVLTRPHFILGEKSVVGRDTVLGDREPSGQVGRHARVGMDVTLT